MFDADADYAAFWGLVGEVCGRVPVRVLAACLVPNHFHLVLRPRGDGDLSLWMHRLLSGHVRRYHRLRPGGGVSP